MKILEAIYANTLGGSETLALRLAHAFISRGHDCDILTVYIGDGTFAEGLATSGLKVFAVDYDGRSITKRLLVPLKLWRLFRQQKYDLIHCHHMSAYIRCLKAARMSGLPGIVVTEHAHQHFPENHKLRRRSRKFARQADGVTVIHTELLRYFNEELRVPRDLLHLIPNGVDIEKFQGGQAPEQITHAIEALGKDRIVIGCVSRFHPDKDMPNLVNAFKHVDDAMPGKCSLVIVGDGQEMQAVQAQAAELGIAAQILFAGVQNNIPEWLRAFDLFVLPSRREGMPLVLLEALSAGLPVVSTNTGGVADIIDDTVGRLAPPENSRELANAILPLLRDEPGRREMAANARHKAETHYSFDAMVDRYLAVFEQVHAERSRPGS